MLSTRAPFQAATVSRTTVRGASVVVSARPTKAADFRGLDNGEILQKVDELKKEKFRLQYMQKTRGNMLNPGEVRLPRQADPQQQHHQQQQWQQQQWSISTCSCSAST
jgi:ribosomal protein L29